MVTEARIRAVPAHAVRRAGGRGRPMTAAIIEDKTGRPRRTARSCSWTRPATATWRIGWAWRPTGASTCSRRRRAASCAGLKAIKKAHPDFNIHKVIFDKKYPQAIRHGYAWSAAVPGDCGCPPEGPVPGGDDLLMLAGTRVHGADCSDADQLRAPSWRAAGRWTRFANCCASISWAARACRWWRCPPRSRMRESRHVRALHQLTVDECSPANVSPTPSRTAPITLTSTVPIRRRREIPRAEPERPVLPGPLQLAGAARREEPAGRRPHRWMPTSRRSAASA